MTNEPEGALLSIGRFSRLCGLSVGALRHYGSFGLLPPARVDPDTGYRFYAHRQLESARLIARLRAVEMSLPEIRAAIGLPPAELRVAVARHRARMEARTVRLQRIVHQLSQEIPMPPKTEDPLDAETHRTVAVSLFNHVWTLLEVEQRTPEQDDEMVHAAHASCWHWRRVGAPDEPQRLAVGEWQCSRVYSVLGRPEPALHHARRCLALTESHEMEDWVAASGAEAMARAHRAAGDRAAFEEWRARAVAATAAIADPEDREVIEGDIETLGA
jgi:DNA-binding transcriptional MerR regulator